MSTGAPLGSDLKLHWLFSVLVGVSAKCGDVVFESDEWDVQKQVIAPKLWGKTYKVTDIKIFRAELNFSTDLLARAFDRRKEIDFALQIIGEIIEPMLREMKSLLDEVTLDHDRKCNFVKACTMAKAALCGISTLVVIGPPSEPGDPVTDWGLIDKRRLTSVDFSEKYSRT
ncbi:hypothetical protein BY996DRAFT_6418059 [Phakopsora pachyrhizi]|nr:hypothetical protein BY996DRAFT_6418059 [Phakopsora pachyrhizi]